MCENSLINLLSRFKPVSGMKRRAFLSLLSVVAVAWPLAVRAQQRALVAIVNLQSTRALGALLVCFLKDSAL
jgi:hypothetical protein